MTSNVDSASILSAATVPVVSVQTSQTSKDNIPWDSTEHHIALVFNTTSTTGYSGAFSELPGFSGATSSFPAVKLTGVEFEWTPLASSATFVAAMSIAGATMDRASARGKKQRFRFGTNNFSINIPQRGEFKFGDLVSGQLKPVSSTAAAPLLYFTATGNADCVIDLFFVTAGPMDLVVAWGENPLPTEVEASSAE